MRALFTTLLLLGISCTSVDVRDHYSHSEMPAAVDKSNKAIKARKAQLLGLSLLDKATRFEESLTRHMPEEFAFCPKYYESDQPGPYRMDMTALFLSASAFKYAVTHDKQDKQLILKILHSIYMADEANGLDGFLPYKLEVRDNQICPTSNNTHINVYTQ